MRKTVTADRGPAPACPYFHAVVANGFVCILVEVDCIAAISE